MKLHNQQMNVLESNLLKEHKSKAMTLDEAKAWVKSMTDNPDTTDREFSFLMTDSFKQLLLYIVFVMDLSEEQSKTLIEYIKEQNMVIRHK